ncbi:hypothetical protein QZH41_001027 [Actinostola sp. cb2023]|nr:hypothetical protein QZH41_001027 [Actinostola sp. cb2023]
MSGLPHRESFYVRLPSNVITTEQMNTAWDYMVPLPYALNFTELDEWTVAVTSVFLPPLGKQNVFDNVFIYSNLVTGTLVGNVEAPLLCTVDMKAGLVEGMSLGGMLREPEQLMYCPLRVGYIESIHLILRNEFGKTLVVFDRGQTVVVLHFLKKRLPMGERRLVLPSNSSKELYPDNTGHTFTVRLPASLNYVPDDWEVGMVYLAVPTPEGRIEQLSPMRQVGIGVIPNNVWFPISGAKWHNLPEEKYHSTESLVKAFNTQVHEVITQHVQNVNEGSCVVDGSNELIVYALVYTAKQTKPAFTYYRRSTLAPGLDTVDEILKWVNGVFSLNKITSHMFAGSGPTDPPKMETTCTYSIIKDSDGKGHSEGFTVTGNSIMKRLGFTEGKHEGDFQADFNMNILTSRSESVQAALDNSRWTKIWMEEDQNTVVLKRWTLDKNLHVMMSLELVDYFGFPKNKSDAELGFKPQPNPPAFIKPDKTQLVWQGGSPMVWSGKTWTLPDTGSSVKLPPPPPPLCCGAVSGFLKSCWVAD